MLQFWVGQVETLATSVKGRKSDMGGLGSQK